jgi:hypothetical protein
MIQPLGFTLGAVVPLAGFDQIREVIGVATPPVVETRALRKLASSVLMQRLEHDVPRRAV